MLASLISDSPSAAAFMVDIPAMRPSVVTAPVSTQPIPEWSLDNKLTFLNHGSYGAVPRAALRYQAQLRERLERDPVRFYKVDLEALLDDMRERLGNFLNCRPADLAPLPNATVALCTILNNTKLAPGDEILVTDHEYQSLPNELERICARTGAVVVTASIPFPVTDSRVVLDRFLAAVTPRTKLAFVSHITSCTSLVFPVAAIVKELNSRGVDVCIDGAHSPGQVPVDISALKPTYFIGSGHKWLSGPKGIGFLYVRSDKQRDFRPLQLSSRASKIRPERALFLRDFDYQGTLDYSHILTLPRSIDAMSGLLLGGWPQLMRENHEKIMQARAILARMLAPVLGESCCVHTSPEHMTGTMTSIIIPEPRIAERPTLYDDALQDALYERHGIVTPVWRFNATNSRVVRLSAQVYNSLEQYEKFGQALLEELRRERD